MLTTRRHLVSRLIVSGPAFSLPLQTLLAQTATTLRYNFVVFVQDLRPPFVIYFNPNYIIPRTLTKYSLDYTVITNHDQSLRTPQTFEAIPSKTITFKDHIFAVGEFYAV